MNSILRRVTFKAFPKKYNGYMSFATSEAEKTVLVDNSNGKLTLKLNRPKALNSLTLEMVDQLYSELKPINDNKSNSKLVMLLTNSEKAFCAGGDVVAVTKSQKAGTSVCRDFFRNEYKLNHLIGTLKVPFVALMDGITMGGGCGVSINGRFRVVTERTLFSMPETALGLFPDAGGSYFLSHLEMPNFGMFLGLTGHRLKGADILHAGLATHYIESNKIPDLLASLREFPAEKCNDANVMHLLDGFVSNELPKFTLQKHLHDIEKGFEAETVEQVLNNLARINSDFAKSQTLVLQKMSPTSLKVTIRQLNECRSKAFHEVFPIEYRLTQRFLQDHDLHEGCRAILLDKDRNPKWKPASLAEVSQEKVDWYFSPLPNPDEELVL